MFSCINKHFVSIISDLCRRALDKETEGFPIASSTGIVFRAGEGLALLSGSQEVLLPARASLEQRPHGMFLVGGRQKQFCPDGRSLCSLLLFWPLRILSVDTSHQFSLLLRSASVLRKERWHGVCLGDPADEEGCTVGPRDLAEANLSSLERCMYGCPGWVFGKPILLFVPCPGLEPLNFIINVK